MLAFGDACVQQHVASSPITDEKQSICARVRRLRGGFFIGPADQVIVGSGPAAVKCAVTSAKLGTVLFWPDLEMVWYTSGQTRLVWYGLV